MPLVKDYYTPQELTNLSRILQDSEDRTVETNYRFAKTYYFEDRINDINYSVKAGTRDVPTLAKFRTWDSQNPVGSLEGFADIQGELLPLGLRYFISEFDRQLLKVGGEDRFNAAVLNAAKRATLGVIARMEKASIDNLRTGGLVFTDERGITTQVVWGRNPNRTYTAAVPWTSQATSKPLEDMLAIQQLLGYDEINLVMTPRTKMALRRNESLRNEFRNAGTNVIPTTLRDNELDTTFSDFGITIDKYAAKYAAKDKLGNITETPLLPDGEILAIGGSNKVGSAVWGVTREAMEPEYGVNQSSWSGIVSAHYRTEHPIQDWINAAAIGLPVLAEPDRTACVKVF